jgi:DNA repair exonuclease SbcCD ATPase subunit
MSQQTSCEPATVTVENIGGIDACELTLDPGVTILTGQNATGRTSLLTALAGALGGSMATLKSDAEEGFVKLSLGEETYSRRFVRSNGDVTKSGSPYSENTDIVDLFACLLENNAARQAIQNGQSLRELIMRPVDTDAIQETIHQLEDERTELNTRINEIRSKREQIPELEERKGDLEDRLQTITEELESVRGTVDEYEAEPEEAGAAQEAFDELERLRQQLNRKQSQADTHRETLRALKTEQAELESEMDSLSIEEDELSEIESELTTLQERERRLSDLVTELSAIVDFNEDLLSNEGPDLDLLSSTGQGVTAQLDPATELVECWTCGSEVEQREIRDRLDELRDVITEKRNELHELEDTIETLRTRRANHQRSKTRKTELEAELEEARSDIKRRERQLESVENEIDELRDKIEAQEERVRETEELRDSELLDAYERLSELQYKRGQLEQELSDIEDDLAEIHQLDDELEQLEAQREEVQEELKSQRTRIEDLEREAIEAFNTRMEDILDILEYRNIERVWIERKEGTKFDSRRGGYRGGSVSTFDLHVVRSNEDGAVYEDTVDTLSESEREVIGLVVALSGYLVHQVYEVVPMMLLDSLEAIDATRIARLIEYFADHAPFLVVALLPEDAQALDESFNRIPAQTIAAAE